MSKTKLLFLALLAPVLAIVPMTAAKAFELKTDSSVYVAKDEVVAGTLYAAGQTITIDGNISGDVICAGQSITINGDVAGSVICAGQSVTINGQITDNVRVAGNSVVIAGSVGKNVNAFGANIVLGSDSNVGWDVLAAGATVEARGKIGRSLHGGGAQLALSGQVGENVEFNLDDNNKNQLNKDKANLIIDKNAVINGNLVYTSAKDAAIADGAVISGETTKKSPKVRETAKNFAAFWKISILYSLFSALLIGLVLVSLFPEYLKKVMKKMEEKKGASILAGLVVMIVVPVVSILVMFTFIGIPLALITLTFWVLTIALAKIIFGIFLGQKITERFWKTKKDSLVIAMIIGILVISLVFSIPLIGWLIAMVAIWWTLGAMWINFRAS